MTARNARIRETLAEATQDLARISIQISVDALMEFDVETPATRYATAHTLLRKIDAAMSRLAVMRDLAATEVEARGKAMDAAHDVGVRMGNGAVFDQRDPGDETPEIEADGFVSIHPKPAEPTPPTWAERYVKA